MRQARAWLWWLLLTCTGAVAAPATLPRAPGTDLRVLAWNVSRENFYQHADAFVAVLNAIDADVLILDEMSADRTDLDVRSVLRRVGADNNARRWQLSYGRSGFNQRAVIAVRGEVRGLPEFARLPYPATFIDSMRAESMNPSQRAELASSIAGGVGANGALVRIGSRKLLVIGVDLHCCGDRDDAWEERRRIVESALIRKRLQRALAHRRVDAIVVGGDFNALRGLSPVRTLQGSEHAHAHLDLVHSRHHDGSDWTWDGRGTPFKSSHIDYLLHDRGLRVLASVIFDAETLPLAQVEALGLSRDFMRKLTAHRPVVADFAWATRSAYAHSRK